MRAQYNLSPDLEQALIKRRKEGATLKELADWLGKILGRSVSFQGLSDWFIRKNIVPEPERKEPKEQITYDKTIESLRAETAYYKRLYQQSIKDSAGIEILLAAFKEIIPAIPPIGIEYKTPIIHATSPQSVIAPLCDAHIGECIDYEQMVGLNSYNVGIFNRRLYGWSQQVAKLVELRRSYVEVPRLYVPILGDMVSGEIHMELIKTNVLNMVEQASRGAFMIAQALMSLAPGFQEVIVPCISGNHSRMTQKPPSKDRWADWDHLLYQMVAIFCNKQKNIKFQIPKSFLHVFNVEGKNILIIHGDSIQQWQGIPWYGMVRAFAQLRQIFQFRRGLEEDIDLLIRKKGSKEDLLGLFAEYFDSVLVGHFHQSSELDIGTGVALICSSIKGGDEYSFGKLHSFSRPSQILTYWHPKWGYISKDIIYLDKYDNSNEVFIDALPEVWNEARGKN